MQTSREVPDVPISEVKSVHSRPLNYPVATLKFWQARRRELDGDELRNMFTRAAQSGLWFIAGSFAQCRIYSKYLALQIKASEIGLLMRYRPRP